MNTISLRATPFELIDRANNVPVFDVLRDWFGLNLPREGRSFKSRCPFSWEHPDGGIKKVWRTYPATNSTYCFVGHGYMGPVRLVAIQEDKKPLVAAKSILQKYDLMKPRAWRDRFRELQIEREQREAVGTAWVVAALHEGLRLHDGYEAAQYTTAFGDAVEEELEGLDMLLQSGLGTDDQVRVWYAAAKGRLLTVIGERA